MDDIRRPNRREDLAASTVRRTSADWIAQFQKCLLSPDRAPTPFASENSIAEAYPTMRLRAFGKAKTGVTTTLIVTPVGVHDAGFVDLMRGHSLVGALREAHGGRIHVTDWTSATPDMAHLSVDHYLADLNVAIDDLGGDVNVVGLGMGGCLALLHAARFPGKIKRLVLAGVPADVSARASLATRFARNAIERDEAPDGETVCSAQWFAPGAAQGHERAAIETLQRNPASFARQDLDAIAAFEAWAGRSVDAPGRYARDILTRIFGANELARGAFVALGRTIDLKTVKIPIFILAGAYDEITPSQQALAAMHLVGTPKARMRSLVATCGHYSLFVGSGVLTREWRTIAGWLQSSAAIGKARAPRA